METKIKIGISACLLGENVRYDGQNALARHITGPLAEYLDFYPICPEVGCGMGVPREPVRLVGTLENNKLMGRESGKDWTGIMRTWAEKTLPQIEEKQLCGFIFKAKSPSSGMCRIKIYPEEGGQPNSYAGTGLFAGMLMERYPLLPVEDEGRLHDIVLRGNFIERLFVEHRWNKMLASGRNMKNIIDFHSRHKMLIRSHDVTLYRALGKLVGEGKHMGLEKLFESYHALMSTALAKKPTIKKNVDVLMHIMGYFKKLLTTDEKKECLELIGNYKTNLLPLIVPVTLMNHYVRKYDVAYLNEQYYLNPHPLELKLRNHA
ncbi:YbgA family protein [Pseudodesulfovibrio piezophilus]|uniref:DUF1722 domain-containing protein n=1 Tax=Pseudodesulfovibrio piezophilus (strain DSM 21447 / JCM 15486 / C1TLV30) TaxID=1322246 RepID=M1WP85_PSEP2|nr:DUF523 and DUF1722 domain-containing protein [Pseudodesulfovibrio piezophilus]CCH48139.1 conserved protein of unknown function [Pseudodesulfovibrio piezophilus C1TLV30]